MKTGEELDCQVCQSPRLPRVVRTPHPRNGRQDPPNPDARESTDHQSEQRLYRETCRSPLEDLDLDGNFSLQPDQQLRLRQRTGSSTTIKVGILGDLQPGLSWSEKKRKEVMEKVTDGKGESKSKGVQTQKVGWNGGWNKVGSAKEMEEKAKVTEATEFRFCRSTTLMAT